MKSVPTLMSHFVAFISHLSCNANMSVKRPQKILSQRKPTFLQPDSCLSTYPFAHALIKILFFFQTPFFVLSSAFFSSSRAVSCAPRGSPTLYSSRYPPLQRFRQSSLIHTLSMCTENRSIYIYNALESRIPA